MDNIQPTKKNMGNLTSSYDYKKPSAKLNDVIGAIMFDDVLDSQERCMSDYHMLLGSEAVGRDL